MSLPSPTVTVFRFENDKGLGPWSGGASGLYDKAQRTRDRGHSCSNMASPYSVAEQSSALHDHARKRGIGDWRFGFLSLRQLRRAFPSGVGRAAMGKGGDVLPQRLEVYEVPADDVVTGNAQIIFNPERARKVGRLDLRTLQPIAA